CCDVLRHTRSHRRLMTSAPTCCVTSRPSTACYRQTPRRSENIDTTRLRLHLFETANTRRLWGDTKRHTQVPGKTLTVVAPHSASLQRAPDTYSRIAFQ